MSKLQFSVRALAKIQALLVFYLGFACRQKPNVLECAVGFLQWGPTVECSSSNGLRASSQSNYTEVYAGQNALITTETLIAATLCW